MLFLTQPDLEYKIAPPESSFIIGSNFLDDQGDVYLMDIKVINTPSNRRNKRMFDIITSLTLLATFPISAFLVGSFLSFLKNIIKVLTGKYTWVSFADTGISMADKYFQPVLKKGVLSPADGLLVPVDDPNTISRLNVLYAKDYNVEKDFRILLRSIKELGRKVV